MKINSNDDCYAYMRLTHLISVYWGFPITRRKTKNGYKNDGDTDVQGHRYSFDLRVTPIWLAYATLDAYVLYYNYLTASGYVGESFKKYFEELYCFAVIELANRNLGPFTMFYGRRNEAAALAGTERVLAFIGDTDLDATPLLSPAVKYYSAAAIVAYWARMWLYTVVQPATVMAMFCANALCQTALYNLAMFQYYVLARGYARVNWLLEEAAQRPRDAGPVSAGRVARLANACDELGRLVDHVDQAYTLGLLLRWPYTIVRIVMLVFRIIKYAAIASPGKGHPMSRMTIALIIEHVGEILIFLQQLTIFCVTGTRPSDELTHVIAICFGLPYTRRKMKEGFNPNGNVGHLAGRYRYSFDKRLIPVWMLYACLNVYVVHYNYLEGVRYVAGSFRTCFEESYCFALIELLNRNLGPSSNVMCSMFYGRWHKIAGLAGAERTLQFLDDTRDAVPLTDRHGLSRAVWYAAPASLAAYASMSQFYMILVPPTVVVAYWFNGMGQMVVYILVFVQYYVLARGFSRVNDMVEALDVARDPMSAGRSLARLTSVYDELCTLAGHVNRAYAPEMLLQWAYNIIRVIMVVFRLMEIASSLDGPMAWATSYLLVQHLGELFIFVVHTSCVCTVGDRLSSESKRILASLEKLRLRNRVNMNIEIKKAVDIFYVRATARNVYASIGGFIIFDMSLIRCVCSVLATYVLVLIQFRDQKGNSKPLYYNWN